MKVVLDTNVLASGIFWGGVPFKIIKLWQEEKIELFVSSQILDEYLRTIQKLTQKLNRNDLYEDWISLISAKTTLISIKKSFHVCRDPHDNKFIDCAIASKAKYIITGDNDLLVLQKIMNVQIVKPISFLSIFSKK